jgi:phosphoribosylformylglycinamidine synthase
MELLTLPGGEALSAFRLAALQRRLQALWPVLTNLQMRHFHLAAFDMPPGADALHCLKQLLGEYPALAEAPGRRLFVLPRLGTISPWASKAGDIARVCGVTGLAQLERGRVVDVSGDNAPDEATWRALIAALHDPMTESVIEDGTALQTVFQPGAPRPSRPVAFLAGGRQALERANRDWGLALSEAEIAYLDEAYALLRRDPTEAELTMFAQINSEHCRHKTFNADWTIDGAEQENSLFDMICMSHAAASEGVLLAYKDNAAVIEGLGGEGFFPTAERRYESVREPAHICMKVETHNHPTAISPFAGAATGAGGEIRDEAATGRGGRPKAGLCGFSVSNLRIPDFIQPWEADNGRPARLASALEIMLDGPIGAARYNNEFGRPNLCGYFRSFEAVHQGQLRGYHKPIMIAGGVGNIRPRHVDKEPVPAGAKLVVLGGPAMLIGLGGGAASSLGSGVQSEALDFASVQRPNPEMERRCQQVIDACRALGRVSPILSIHDVGAGGLSNAIPEILNNDGRGGRLDLKRIPSADPGLSPAEIWWNEAQERYVLAVDDGRMEAFERLCGRERCPFAVVGEATREQQLILADDTDHSRPVDLPMPVLLGKTPRMHRQAWRAEAKSEPLGLDGIRLEEAAERVLHLPGVASKGFLITIGDRTVGGQVCRDQMVGPWQVPVSDVAVTASGFTGYTGEAMAMGERAPLALLDAPAAGRMAVGEALTNIAAAGVGRLGDVRLSANWMVAAGEAGEDARLFDTVRAVGAELCSQLGVAIPVGKDSLSMRTTWRQDGENLEITAPLSLVISAFAPVADVRRTLTPELRRDAGETCFILVDLGAGRHRLGGSALAQVYGLEGGESPDVGEPRRLAAFLTTIRELAEENTLLAYHDRSDGGLLVTLLEMAFAGRCGLDIDLANLAGGNLAALFNEELGAVLQVRDNDRKSVLKSLSQAGLDARAVGKPSSEPAIVLRRGPEELFRSTRATLHRAWAETSYRMQALRDEPQCAREEFDSLLDDDDPGLHAARTFDPAEDVSAPFAGTRPRVAILREQGVNGHHEMAWAFHRAGFDAVDVHMSEILSGEVSLSNFHGLAACGGFSYGDVLGAGQGWAKSILFNSRARDVFQAFFQRPDTFTLGVCNGCQMLASLRDLIPGAQDWPEFLVNRSEQFEARFSLVRVEDSRSILLHDMAGSRLPIAVAHGEGRAAFADEAALQRLCANDQLALRFVDHDGRATTAYPFNPNGSPQGITGLCSADGRTTIFMPHPERVVRTVCNSWHPPEWDEDGPWLRLFQNARRWLG